MAKNLKVIKPFYVMEVGDTFELSEDGKTYTSTYNEENHENSDFGVVVNSTFTSNYSISIDYAKELIKTGFLEEVVAKKMDNSFINVFDEIDNLLNEYTEELANIDEEFANFPACLKVERETVLNNICTVLNHLKSLKK